MNDFLTPPSGVSSQGRAGTPERLSSDLFLAKDLARRSFEENRKKSKILRVLLVDSVGSGANLSMFLLKKRCCSFNMVASTSEAVAAVRARVYDLILLDLSVLKRDSCATVLALKQMMKSWPIQAKIAAMSFSHNTRAMTMLKSCGVSAFINKSKAGQELVQLLSTCELACGGKTRAKADRSAYNKLTKEFKADCIEVRQFSMILIGKLRTASSCLRPAFEEKNLKSLDFLSKSLQEACENIGLEDLSQMASNLVYLAESRCWDALAASIMIIEVEINAAIRELKLENDLDAPAANLLF